MTVTGQYASDTMCIAHYGTFEEFTEPTTTICSKDQQFLLVTTMSRWNWSMKATDTKYIDSVCGLGKERANSEAKGWLAKAANEGKIAKQVYSINLIPFGEDSSRQQSYLSIGGYNQNDIVGKPAWFDTSEGAGSWKSEVTDFKIDVFKDIHNTGGSVSFQTGYPYISLPAGPYRLFTRVLQHQYPAFACDRVPDYGVCRIRNVKCKELDISAKLTITVNNFDFTIPIKNLLIDI